MVGHNLTCEIREQRFQCFHVAVKSHAGLLPKKLVIAMFQLLCKCKFTLCIFGERGMIIFNFYWFYYFYIFFIFAVRGAVQGAVGSAVWGAVVGAVRVTLI